MFSLVSCSRGPDTESAPAFGRPAFERPTDAGPPGLSFVDVSQTAGISFLHYNGATGRKWMPETVGAGGGFLDYDGDGWQDIFFVNGREWPGDPVTGDTRSRLYRNQGDGSFVDVTDSMGIDVRVYGMGAAFGDYDADGDDDIYITAVGENVLLRNDGSRFNDVTRLAGVRGDPSNRSQWSTGAAWLDYDRDGYLDLFVCNYVRWSPDTDLWTTLDGVTKSYATPDVYEGDSCELYRNRGNGRFVDVTRDAGVFNPEGKSLGVLVLDYDADGWPDIAVSNDTEANFLYHNGGDGTFEDVALGVGVGYDEFGRARAGMGIDAAVLNGEGPVIAIGNFAREPVSLYTLTTPQLFVDRAAAAGLAGPTLIPLTFGVRFDDFDLDGSVDLFLANGHIEPEISRVRASISFEQTPQLLLARGNRFVDYSADAGAPFGQPIVGRGAATADYDRDGDPDLLITVNDGTARLLRNDQAENRGYLAIRLDGEPPNVRAIGATVDLYTGDRHQSRYVRTSSSYLSQSQANPVIFGVDGTNTVDSVLVRWPTTGTVTRIVDVAVNREVTVTER